MNQTIVLCNPPFGQQISRDFQCPHVYHSDYAWPPIDLLAISGIARGNPTFYIDALREKWGAEETLRAIQQLRPDLIFLLLSSISLDDDLHFIRIVKQSTGARIAVLGDLATFDVEHLSTIQEIDFIIRDFTNAGAIQAIIAGAAEQRVAGFSTGKTFAIGIPQHELFLRYHYHMPYSLYNSITCTITNYGCPFQCKFCNSNQLGFKARDLDETCRDLEAISRLGIKEIFFRDFTFGLPNTQRILDYMIRQRLPLNFSCEIRVDTVDQPTLLRLKHAGCFLAFYGVESGNQATLDTMQKGFTIGTVLEKVALTKRAGIETLTSFIFGFEHETRSELQRTIDFIFRLDPDYLSINVLTLRYGSTIRQEAGIDGSSGRVDGHGEENGIATAAHRVPVEAIDLFQLRNHVEKRFFFRPLKLARYLRLSLKSPHRFLIFLNQLRSIGRRIFLSPRGTPS